MESVDFMVNNKCKSVGHKLHKDLLRQLSSVFKTDRCFPLCVLLIFDFFLFLNFDSNTSCLFLIIKIFGDEMDAICSRTKHSDFSYLMQEPETDLITETQQLTLFEVTVSLNSFVFDFFLNLFNC